MPICFEVLKSLVGQQVKNLLVMQETQVRYLGGKIPRRREWQPTPVFLPGESLGQRCLAATVHGVAKSWKQLSD